MAQGRAASLPHSPGLRVVDGGGAAWHGRVACQPASLAVPRTHCSRPTQYASELSESGALGIRPRQLRHMLRDLRMLVSSRRTLAFGRGRAWSCHTRHASGTMRHLPCPRKRMPCHMQRVCKEPCMTRITGRGAALIVFNDVYMLFLVALLGGCTVLQCLAAQPHPSTARTPCMCAACAAHKGCRPTAAGWLMQMAFTIACSCM